MWPLLRAGEEGGWGGCVDARKRSERDIDAAAGGGRGVYAAAGWLKGVIAKEN